MKYYQCPNCHRLVKERAVRKNEREFLVVRKKEGFSFVCPHCGKVVEIIQFTKNEKEIKKT